MTSSPSPPLMKSSPASPVKLIVALKIQNDVVSSTGNDLVVPFGACCVVIPVPIEIESSRPDLLQSRCHPGRNPVPTTSPVNLIVTIAPS